MTNRVLIIDDDRGRTLNGSGLGLNIVWQPIERMGGRGVCDGLCHAVWFLWYFIMPDFTEISVSVENDKNFSTRGKIWKV